MRSVVLLVTLALAIGAALTGLAALVSSSADLSAFTWLGSVATVGSLVVAIGIFRVQHRQQDAAHAELLDRLDAQDDLIKGFTQTTTPDAGPAAAEEDVLSDAQRIAIEAQYGPDSIAAAWRGGPGGRGNRARLVRLHDGRVVAVYDRGRRGGTAVHELGSRRRDR